MKSDEIELGSPLDDDFDTSTSCISEAGSWTAFVVKPVPSAAIDLAYRTRFQAVLIGPFGTILLSS